MEYQSIRVFEELKDSSEYIYRNWLRLPNDPRLAREIVELAGGAAYIFDTLLLHEGAGAKISEEVHAHLGRDYSPKELVNKAANLKLRFEEKDFMKGPSEFVKYLVFLLETEDYIKAGLLDIEGKFAFTYMEALIALFLKYNPEQSPLRISEVVILKMSDSFAYIYKTTPPLNYKGLASREYFDGVGEAFERIRAEILD